MIEDHQLPDIDIRADSPVEDVLKVGSVCNRSGHCSRFGAGYILPHEVKPIAEFLGISESEFLSKYAEPVVRFNTKTLRFRIAQVKDRPYGPCNLFEQETNDCRIHEVKPLYCRITNCSSKGKHLQQWFDVNHFVNRNDPQSIREWDIVCQVTDDVIPGGHVSDLVDDARLEQIRAFVDLKRPEHKDGDDEFVEVRL
ncbi:MAG: YkgJ family cysteine cluster protein [Nanoarchaeota archaeon]